MKFIIIIIIIIIYLFIFFVWIFTRIASAKRFSQIFTTKVTWSIKYNILEYLKIISSWAKDSFHSNYRYNEFCRYVPNVGIERADCIEKRRDCILNIFSFFCSEYWGRYSYSSGWHFSLSPSQECNTYFIIPNKTK